MKKIPEHPPSFPSPQTRRSLAHIAEIGERTQTQFAETFEPLFETNRALARSMQPLIHDMDKGAQELARSMQPLIALSRSMAPMAQKIQLNMGPIIESIELYRDLLRYRQRPPRPEPRQRGRPRGSYSPLRKHFPTRYEEAYEAAGPNPTQLEVANKLGISERHLRRLLKQAGINWR